MHHRGVVAGQHLDVVGGQPHAVRRDDVAVQQPQRLQVLGRPQPPGALPHCGVLPLLLGQMDVHGHAGVGRVGGDGAQALRRHRVGRVGPKPHVDQVAGRPPVPEGHHLVELVGPRSGPAEVGILDHARGHQAAQPRVGGALGEGLAVEVHLHRGGDAVGKQFGRPQPHPGPHVVTGELRFPRPHHLVQPPVHGQPLARASQQHHRRVAVGADEARHEDPGSVHCGTRREFGRSRGRAAPDDPPVVAHVHSPIRYRRGHTSNWPVHGDEQVTQVPVHHTQP